MQEFAQRRLRNVKLLRRFGKILITGNTYDILEFFKIQEHHLHNYNLNA